MSGLFGLRHLQCILNSDSSWMFPKVTKYFSKIDTKVAMKGEIRKWYFVTKIVLTYCEKNCSSDRAKLLKFEAEVREFAKN